MKKQPHKEDGRRMARKELSSRLAALQEFGKSEEKESDHEAEYRAVLHELEVSQIELEVQNQELIESRQAVDESRDRYLNLYDFAPVGYVTLDKKGTIREMNLAAAEMLGVERQRTLGHSMASRVFAADLMKFRAHLSECGEGEKFETKLRLLGARQSVIPAQLLSSCLRDRITGEILFQTAITDLTDQQRIEKERQEFVNRVENSRKELFDFFMHAPMPVAVLAGPHHVFSLANAHYTELIGKDVMGKAVREVFAEGEMGDFLNVLDRVYQTGESYVDEEALFTKSGPNGERRDYYLNMSYKAFRDNEGGIKGVLVFEQDVTAQVLARKRLERERQDQIRQQGELEKAKNGAERANETKSAFLANMSHEIRTPLGAILGFTELLKETDSEAEKQKFAQIIERNGRALTKLIDDVLDLSKVEAGRLELEQINFNPRELVREITDLFRENLESRGVELKINITSDLPESIVSDPTRLRQILINLIGNAAKFTSRGSVSLKVEPLFENGQIDQIKFSIKDTGIGMTTEQAARLFDPFSQADSSTTRRFGGSGLGLALSRRLARALGGDVNIDASSLGQGCIFSARVKVRPTPLQEGKVMTSADATAQMHSHPFKILLVEDSPDNQDLVRLVLVKAGMSVDVANNGAEGVQMAQAGHYDVVLMDMQMPVLDGYAATEKLRRDGYRGPIVALTAHAMLEEKNRIMALGCDAYLTKPLNSRLLIETIDRLHS